MKYNLKLETENCIIWEQLLNGKIVGFEVHIKKPQPERIRMINGKEVVFKAGFKWPTDEDFGVWAWSFKHFSKAFEKAVSID